MGNEIPRQPYSGRAYNPTDADLAKIIDARMQSIAQLEREKARINEETFLRRVRKLGQVWSINNNIRRDEGIIRAAEERAGDLRGDDQEHEWVEDGTSANHGNLDEPFDRFKR